MVFKVCGLFNAKAMLVEEQQWHTVVLLDVKLKIIFLDITPDIKTLTREYRICWLYPLLKSKNPSERGFPGYDAKLASDN